MVLKMDGKNKKYLIIGIVIIVVAITVISASCVSAGLFDSSSSNALKSSGEYKIGEDIPAGEYYVKCTSSNLYVEISSDSTGSIDSIITNLNTEGGTYITVHDGEYLTIQGGDIYELDKSPNRGAENGYYTNGMYKVGSDIPAGEYSVEATSGMAYIEVASDSSHTIDSIVTNDNFEGNTKITLSDGQYLTLDNGARIKA